MDRVNKVSLMHGIFELLLTIFAATLLFFAFLLTPAQASSDKDLQAIGTFFSKDAPLFSATRIQNHFPRQRRTSLSSPALK
jgi:ATP/ADP translocase